MNFLLWQDVNGPDQFIFIVEDDWGSQSDYQIGTIEIIPFNSKPVAVNMTINVKAGLPITSEFVGTYDPDQVRKLNRLV